MNNSIPKLLHHFFFHLQKYLGFVDEINYWITQFHFIFETLPVCSIPCQSTVLSMIWLISLCLGKTSPSMEVLYLIILSLYQPPALIYGNCHSTLLTKEGLTALCNLVQLVFLWLPLLVPQKQRFTHCSNIPMRNRSLILLENPSQITLLSFHLNCSHKGIQ